MIISKAGLFISFLLLLNAYSQALAVTVNGEPVPVSVKSVEQLQFHPLKTAPAQVISLQNSKLSAEITALVVAINIQVGDRVEKNQLLITLDCEDYKLQKQQLIAEKKSLQANLIFSKYQLERATKLLSSKNISEEIHHRRDSEFKQLSAQLETLNVQLKKAEKTISRCEIKAPFDGVIAERFVNLGEYVVPQTPLVRLINTEDLEVLVQAPIVMIDSLDYQSLSFVYREKAYPVKLRAVIPSIEPRARHQQVLLEFTGAKALPDAFGEMHITLKEKQLPASLLVKRNEQTGVFLMQQQRARFYPLDGAMIGRPATVNLPPESLIIIQGQQGLSDGQRVVLK